jgi:YidC/Oxa1 family membrane protein insertase
VLSASILILSGKISSRNTDPTRRRIVLFLPVVFTAFIARLPAGLFVYWITSNALTLAQNYLIYHHGPGRTASPPSRPDGEAKPSGRGGDKPGGSRALANGASNRSRENTGSKRKRNRRK